MAKNLIIVESPAKTKTLKGFLGKDYAVEASMGHVRDLPKSPISVDIENDFALTYTTIPDRKEVLSKLAAAAKGATTVYLASDPDREGEAIAWHIATALKLKPAQIKRIQFNEITKSAVQAAIANPRGIDIGRVDAQQARRALDRLVGYKVSPILWAKVAKGTSAGRVQSVAVRIIVDREREIKAFVPQEYWTLTATLTPQTPKPQAFDAGLTQFNGKKIELKTENETNQVLADLRGAAYTVAKVKKSERQRRPTAPFITSTIQQEAARKLGFSSKRTMSVAQQLYEGIDLGADGGQVGLITYMRTDSTRIAGEAQAEARQFILTNYGEKYAPAKPNVYKTKGSAQDAHEAIRPTSTFREPDALKAKLSADQYKLYRLVWLRFVASQMTPAVLDVVTADINANAYTFRAAGSTIKFDGFLRVYSEGKDETPTPANKQTDEGDEEKPPLPPLTEGQTLDLQKLLPKQHFTEPPPRFSEASLVKALEEQGIGRPSTYASIISTVQDRGYVELREKRFYPTDLGFAVTDYLVKNFTEIMDVHFTADMETRLDKVEEGGLGYAGLMKAFYDPFADVLRKADKESERMIEETDKICPDCAKPLIKRVSRFGAFFSCTGYPECKYRLDAKAEGADGQAAPAPVELDIPCPNCGKNCVERMGRFGKFVACPGYPTCKYIHKEKPVSIGVACPSCKVGELGEKKSKSGVFYPCNRYPECKFSLPSKPIEGRPCPTCAGMLYETGYRGRVTGLKCATPDCTYVEKYAVGKVNETADAG